MGAHLNHMGEEQLAVKKKYRPGVIEEDPTDPRAIVVHYDVEEYVKGSEGKYVLHGKKQGNTKRIKVKSLSPSTNISQMAAEVVNKCKLLSQKSLGQLENVLMQMQQNLHSQAVAGFDDDGDYGGLALSQEFGYDQYAAHEISLEDLDEVIEELYEDAIEVKVGACRKILQLCRDV